MRIADYIQDSIVDGPGIRFTLFVQGCPHMCEGCHNPQTLDENGGREMSTDEIIREVLKNPLLDGLTLSGGEPFAQASDCAVIARAAKEHGLNVWAYSGWTLEELLASEDPGVSELLSFCDVLIDGPFVLSERTLNLRWRGSSNQRVLNVPTSRRSC